MITTTLNKIKERWPCSSGWNTLLRSLNKTKADDESLPLLHILESNGLDDAFWSLRLLTGADLKKARILTLDLAERSLKFIPEGEARPANVIAASRRFINNECSALKLKEARDAVHSYIYAYSTRGSAYACCQLCWVCCRCCLF